MFGQADFYDRQGQPLTIEQYMKLISVPQRQREKLKRVAETHLSDRGRDGPWVSTVWLGHNHRYGDGPPLIFESMVFGLGEELMDRYATEAEALAGHERVVAEAKKILEAK